MNDSACVSSQREDVAGTGAEGSSSRINTRYQSSREAEASAGVP
jgi:hypothetical protein